ncbi:MAG: hypothetical protein HYV97_17040 [Bdellovibrio sp.]|nr:hypothetical protein [Bdellovibrio sp.]
MKKFTYYLILVLIFLGLSKSLAPIQQSIPYIQNEKVLPGMFTGSPLSLIVVDAFYTGLFIKTYYLKLLAFHAFKRSEIHVVRTNKKYWRAIQDDLGLAIFQRNEHANSENLTPLPPGSIFIGDPAFGTWETTPDGQKVWTFFNAYRRFPNELGWGNWRPNYEFYIKLKSHVDNELPFYGPHKEFGPEGIIRSTNWPEHISPGKYQKTTIREYSKKFYWLPSWSKSP